MKLVAAVVVLVSSTAFAQPADPVDPVEASTVQPPPIITISTMPVTKTIPGAWDERPRTTAWVVTGIAGATLVATVGWYFYRDRYTHVDKAYDADMPCQPDYSRGQGDSNNCFALKSPETARQQHKQDIWSRTELGLGVATGATMLVAAYAWSRHYTPAHSFLVSPTTNGATASIQGSF